jgi:hypothetical protein
MLGCYGRLSTGGLAAARAWRIGIQKDEGGWQPFRYAAYHGHLDVLRVLLARTRIPDMDAQDIIRMPETIGFSSDAIISEDCKARVRELLNQALAESGLMPPSHTPSILQNVNQGNYPAQYLQSHNLRDCESFLPQELPATLEQGQPSSRSTTPKHGYRLNLHNPSTIVA